MDTRLIKLFALLLFMLPAVSMAVTFNANIQFKSNLAVTGAVSATGLKSFVIDHPLDPKNKLLYHFNVESPDVKNVYTHTETLDAEGSLKVALPSYFDALNSDTRYQVTPIGEAMPNLYIKEEEEGTFTISGGVPHGSVSWQITGIRHDLYILRHPIIPEVEKGPNAAADKGVCLYEPLCE